MKNHYNRLAKSLPQDRKSFQQARKSFPQVRKSLSQDTKSFPQVNKSFPQGILTRAHKLAKSLLQDTRVSHQKYERGKCEEFEAPPKGMFLFSASTFCPLPRVTFLFSHT